MAITNKDTRANVILWFWIYGSYIFIWKIITWYHCIFCSQILTVTRGSLSTANKTYRKKDDDLMLLEFHVQKVSVITSHGIFQPQPLQPIQYQEATFGTILNFVTPICKYISTILSSSFYRYVHTCISIFSDSYSHTSSWILYLKSYDHQMKFLSALKAYISDTFVAASIRNSSYGTGSVVDGTYHLAVNIVQFVPDDTLVRGTPISIRGTVEQNKRMYSFY